MSKQTDNWQRIPYTSALSGELAVYLKHDNESHITYINIEKSLASDTDYLTKFFNKCKMIYNIFFTATIYLDSDTICAMLAIASNQKITIPISNNGILAKGWQMLSIWAVWEGSNNIVKNFHIRYPDCETIFLVYPASTKNIIFDSRVFWEPKQIDHICMENNIKLLLGNVDINDVV